MFYMNQQVTNKQKDKKLMLLSIISNFVIFMIMVVGLILWALSDSFDAIDMCEFTWQSNVSLGLFCLVYAFYQIVLVAKKKTKQDVKEPWKVVKQLLAACVIMTGITILLCIPLVYIYNPKDAKYLYNGSYLIYHGIEPLVTLVTFLLLDFPVKNKKHCFWMFIPVVVYFIFFVSMAYTHIDPSTGKPLSRYDWYGVCAYGVGAVIGLFIGGLLAMPSANLLFIFLNQKTSFNKPDKLKVIKEKVKLM